MFSSRRDGKSQAKTVMDSTADTHEGTLRFKGENPWAKINEVYRNSRRLQKKSNKKLTGGSPRMSRKDGWPGLQQEERFVFAAFTLKWLCSGVLVGDQTCVDKSLNQLCPARRRCPSVKICVAYQIKAVDTVSDVQLAQLQSRMRTALIRLHKRESNEAAERYPHKGFGTRNQTLIICFKVCLLQRNHDGCTSEED